MSKSESNSTFLSVVNVYRLLGVVVWGNSLLRRDCFLFKKQMFSWGNSLWDGRPLQQKISPKIYLFG